jgi:membrane-associated phospholipid phosphatase
MKHSQISEAAAHRLEPGRFYEAAQLISHIFHPMLLSIFSIYLVGLYAADHWFYGLGWATFCTVLQVVPPTIFFGIRMRQGIYSDEDVSVREQRNELYLFSFVTLLVGTLIMVLLGAPAGLVAFLLSGVIANLLAWCINLFWKVSIHSASVASCATVATIYVLPLGVVMWIIALAVGWARVYTHNHTVLQVVVGLLLSASVVSMVFAAFGLL